MADSPLDFENTPDPTQAGADRVKLFTKKTVSRPGGQLHYRGDAAGDTIYPVADETYADNAASGSVATHEATFNHSLLHTQNSDIALDQGGANQVTAAEARSHIDDTGNPHGTTAAQTGAVALDGSGAMTGNLDMGGNAIANVGNVDGVDVSADSATNAAHRSNTSNPHAVTAAQVGAYTQAEVDTLIDSTLKGPEGYDPGGSGNFPTTYGGNPVEESDTFRIASADTLGAGTIVNSGDLLIALVDAPGQVDANWMVAESNRDQATETVKGVARLATQVEADTGGDDTTIVTPLKLSNFDRMPTSDQKDAMQNANAPNVANPFATQSDIPAGSAYAKQSVVVTTPSLNFNSGAPVNVPGLTLNVAADGDYVIYICVNINSDQNEEADLYVAVDGVADTQSVAFSRLQKNQDESIDLTFDIDGLTAGQVITAQLNTRNDNMDLLTRRMIIQSWNT